MPLGFIMASGSPINKCLFISIIYDYAHLDLSAFSKLRSIRKHRSASSAIVLTLLCSSSLRMFSTFSVFIIPKVLICLLPLRHLRSGTLRPLTTEWPSSPNLVQVGRHLVAPYSATFLVKNCFWPKHWEIKHTPSLGAGRILNLTTIIRYYFGITNKKWKKSSKNHIISSFTLTSMLSDNLYAFFLWITGHPLVFPPCIPVSQPSCSVHRRCHQ